MKLRLGLFVLKIFYTQRLFHCLYRIIKQQLPISFLKKHEKLKRTVLINLISRIKTDLMLF